MKKEILFLLLYIVKGVIYSQPNGGGIPLTYSKDYFNLFFKGGTSQKNIASFTAPTINDTEEKQKSTKQSPTPATIGVHIPIDIDIKSTASMQYLADSSKLYLLKIISREASGISIHFDKFFLPKGAHLFFYNASRTFYLGSYTDSNNLADSTFQTQFIAGDTVFIEYYEPKNIITVSKLHIYNLGRLFSLKKPF